MGTTRSYTCACFQVFADSKDLFVIIQHNLIGAILFCLEIVAVVVGVKLALPQQRMFATVHAVVQRFVGTSRISTRLMMLVSTLNTS